MKLQCQMILKSSDFSFPNVKRAIIAQLKGVIFMDEAMNEARINRLKETIIEYQDMFATQQKNHPFVTEYDECQEKTDQISDTLYNAMRDQVNAAIDMGFLEGMCFALDVMDVSGNGKNRKLLERFIQIMEGMEYGERHKEGDPENPCV